MDRLQKNKLKPGMNQEIEKIAMAYVHNDSFTSLHEQVKYQHKLMFHKETKWI